ncbi:amino acid/polyamine transporter I [Naematelia encephala]|uniref:Amino acid/polyamine transporter I n=1 Tax=Naematelia encephala TaxID=71784 RepID=A0A1Y2AU05_9TREE|nr:amino acid/polyamine transporter I [Naematelia encephala]
MPDLSIDAEQHGDIAAENRLQELGYEQELVRGISFLGIFGMGLCILCLPVTVYAISVTVMVLGGPVSFLWGWLVWGIISIIIACCMGELVSVYPVASGTYFWSYAMTSPKARNVSSYVNGWFLCIGLVLATLAAVFPFAQGIATSIVIFHPDFVPSNGLNYGIFVALLAVTLALACCGTSFLNLFNKYSAYWTMLVTVVLFITPLVECENRNDIKWVLTHFDQSYSGWGAWAWFCSLLGPAGVLCGFGFMTGMCEECHQPEKNVPKAMVYTQITSVVVGIPFIISTLFIMPDLDVVVGAINSQAAYVILDSAMTHPGGAFALLILAYTCAIGLCVESLTATSRFIWGFARDGGLPFSGWLSKVHPKLQVPLNAMIAICIINLLLALISFGSTTAYSAFLGSCTVLVLSAYIHPLILNIIARGAYTKNAPWSLGRLSLPFNIVSVLSVFVGVIAFCFPSYVIFDATTMNYCIVMVAGFMAISLAYYVIHGRKVFTGPKIGGGQVYAVDVLDRVHESETPASKPTDYKESNVGVDIIEA